MVSAILVLGLVVAVFVGFNIGGSSTGIAREPAVGAGAIGKTAAAALMSIYVFVGGWSVGRNVIETMGGDIVHPKSFRFRRVRATTAPISASGSATRDQPRRVYDRSPDDESGRQRSH
ncbi:hypothetical protein [Natrinema halophilum]|uniref:hypothetical protein n=1 Tax=Natrinema halophilum TaxID=1699371 RepID=UPI0031BAD410